MEIQDGTAKFKVRTKISKEEVQEFADKFIVREDVITPSQFVETNIGYVVAPFKGIQGYKPFIISVSTNGSTTYFNTDYKLIGNDNRLPLWWQNSGISNIENTWKEILVHISCLTIRTIFIKEE